MENPPTRILIIDTALIGDVVYTSSLIGATKLIWPQCEIHALLAPRGEDVLGHHPHVSRIWVFDKSGSQRSFRSMLALGRQLRKTGFDLVLNAHSSLRSRLLTRLTHARLRVGYAGFGSSWCFTHIVQNDLNREHDYVERRINLLRVLGFNVPAEPLLVGKDQAAASWAEDFLSREEWNRVPLLGLVAGSSRSTKRWSSHNFIELGQRWIREVRGRVLIFGGTAEHDVANFIADQIGSAARAVINESLPRVSALLSQCQTVVGGDTGVTYLAVASGSSRVFVLYGSTYPSLALPPPHKAVSAGVPCCISRVGHGAHKCRWGDEAWCMNQITVERLWHVLAPSS